MYVPRVTVRHCRWLLIWRTGIRFPPARSFTVEWVQPEKSAIFFFFFLPFCRAPEGAQRLLIRAKTDNARTSIPYSANKRQNNNSAGRNAELFETVSTNVLTVKSRRQQY